MGVRFVGLTLCLMCYPVHIEPIEPPSSPPAVKVPPPHQSRIAGRVRSHLPKWKKIAGPWHTKVITDGIPLQWTEDPPPFNHPFDSATSLQSRTREFEGCSKTLHYYLEIGSVVPLSNRSETDGAWSTFFPVAKKGTGKLRGCIDLRTINPYLQYQHFKMEGTHSGLHAPPAGLHDQNRPVRPLHAFAYCRARPQVLPVHVQRHKARMHGYAIRSRPSTSHRNQIFAASNQVIK